VFLSLPFIAIIAAIDVNIMWIAIPLGFMLATLAVIWPLAFSTKARAWYRQQKR
jgi:hypothetical protein